MAVSASAAYATYPNSVVLNEVMKVLERGGVDKESVFMLLSPKHPMAMIVRESKTNPLGRAASVATAGLIGWLADFGAVVIPTFGFFIRSREFFHALVAERECVAGCGRRGTLVSLGFSQEDAERLEQQVREVGVLVYVTCPEAAQTEWALELLRATGAEEAGLLLREAALETVA